MQANEIRRKKNVDIRGSKGYTDVATQINIIPQRYTFGKSVCFWSSYPLWNDLCSSKIGAAFFVRGFGCAFFILNRLRVLFVTALRTIQDGAKRV